MAYLVSQGTRELGIRLALGATPRGILLLIVRHGMTRRAARRRRSAWPGAFVLTRFMQQPALRRRRRDPLTFVAIPLLLPAIALLAS